MYRCLKCGLTRSSGRPRAECVSTSSVGTDRDDPDAADALTDAEAAASYVEDLERRGAPRSRVLLIAPPGHPFADFATRRGYQVQTVLTGEDLGQLPSATYDSAVILFELAKTADPAEALRRVHEALVPRGVLLLITLSLDSWAARFAGAEWHGWRPETRFYFDTQIVRSLVTQSGFAETEVRRDRRRYRFDHIYRRARQHPRAALSRAVRLLYRLAPPLLRRARIAVTSSAIVVTARRADRRVRPLLSIIVPVYNERATFATAMDAVLAKTLPHVDREIIIVESNSTDGTRELALRYQNEPGVALVLEDRPRGKGHAVRAGLARARGDFILIQDADLEYDVNDYDALIEPLRTYRRAFVLGSRHLGDWKVRKFSQQRAVAMLFNLGHVVFVTLLNLLYGQRLRDPFTMYKVFRRDCLHGLRFECDRFDFDFELVIKLIRRGYAPLEIPVNYSSRSTGDGKKVSLLRDPPTWIWALIKFRFSPLKQT